MSSQMRCIPGQKIQPGGCADPELKRQRTPGSVPTPCLPLPSGVTIHGSSNYHNRLLDCIEDVVRNRPVQLNYGAVNTLERTARTLADLTGFRPAAMQTQANSPLEIQLRAISAIRETLNQGELPNPAGAGNIGRLLTDTFQRLGLAKEMCAKV